MKKKGIIITSLIVVAILIVTFIGTTSVIPQESNAATCGKCNGTCYENICGGEGFFYPVAGNIGTKCDYCRRRWTWLDRLYCYM